MAHITKRGDSWRVIVQVAGQRRERSVRCSHADAKRLGREMERDLERIAKRRKVGLREVVHFSGMLADYEKNVLPTKREATQAGYSVTLTAYRFYFVATLEDPALDDVQPEHVQDYLNWRRFHTKSGAERERWLSERTIEKEYAILHSLLERARRLRWCASNPVASVKKPEYAKREPVLLTPEQNEQLLAECKASRNPMLALYVLLLREIGVRSKSEALWIKWEDVDLETGRILVRSSFTHATKTAKSRYVSMPPILREAMRDHFARYRFATHHGERTAFVFHHVIDNRSAKAGARIESMYRGFKRAAKRAGLPSDVRVHDLRHQWITLSLADGVSMAHVQQAAGHANFATTEGYAHLVPDQYLSGFEARYSTESLATATIVTTGEHTV